MRYIQMIVSTATGMTSNPASWPRLTPPASVKSDSEISPRRNLRASSAVSIVEKTFAIWAGTTIAMSTTRALEMLRMRWNCPPAELGPP